MVNPTGYTALDMIGFTDKGAYLSSDNYVKNDLVHYSGNIWRCLIDDTTGIAPTEGVNWTLFIGEPTNLVERIIAPVETDPATSAWAVGRQIIFNDNLYEVIVAITAGDSLVAYEDDPTNANIKLADPVETQLLNEESTRAAADLALQNNLSNRNLLDNAWFTVNQRGFTSDSNPSAGTHLVDRWAVRYNPSSGAVTVADNIVTLTSNGGLLIIGERFEENVGFSGRITTASIMFSDGTIYSGTEVFPSKNGADKIVITTDDFNVYFQYNSSSGNYPMLAITCKANKTLAIKAVKLELGSISTLAMDTAPDYAEELLKCQRYFIRFSGNPIFNGYVNATTSIRLLINHTMRATPSVAYTAGSTYPQLIYNGNIVSLTADNGFSIGSGIVGSILLAVSNFTGLTANHACTLRLNSGSLDLSADI